MWSLTKIQANNFCSYQQFSWDVPQNVTTLVFGNNMDDDSQSSNGSGKSALIEMVAFGLTGSNLRELKSIEELINDAAEEATVALTFKNSFGGELMVERHLYRKQAQVVNIYQNGNELPTASVNDANKDLLELIGISKDDLYTNFLLSKFKYKSFLSSSDKDKKELLNRFSNGYLVDESIAALQSDMEPLRTSLNEAERSVSYQQGCVNTINDQIAQLKENEGSAKERREAKIADILDQIVEQRKAIRELSDKICNINLTWDDVEVITEAIEKIEDENSQSVVVDYKKICEVWKPEVLGELQDYPAKVSSLQRDLKEVQDQQEENQQILKSYNNQLASLKEQVANVRKEAEEFAQNRQARVSQINDKIAKLDDELNTYTDKIRRVADEKNHYSEIIRTTSAKLMGTIECPKCHHKWITNSDTPVETLQKQLDDATQLSQECDILDDKLRKERDAARQNHTTYSSELDKLSATAAKWNRELMDAETRLNTVKNSISNIQDDCDTTASRLASINNRIADVYDDMYDTIYDTIERTTKRFEADVAEIKRQKAAREGSVDTLESSKKELEEYSIVGAVETLQTARDKAEELLKKAITDKEMIEQQLSVLVVQEARFTEFKTHLANSKIEALSVWTNQFLEAIGSNIRIAFSGVTMLKSGKVRDKISISLLRDGIDCGSFGKFSQGERSRCELATILALQKLINTNCDEGKGLDLLIIDEIMDGTDETGLSNIFDTLNNLQVTSLIVSHGMIQESYQHRLIVNKQNGVSFI